MQLIYFSPVPWASFHQRPHEFAQWAHERLGARVLWVEPYPVRLPALQDVSRPVAAMRGVDVPPWLQVIAPRALPVEPLAAGRWLNRLLCMPTLRRAMREFMQRDAKTVIVVGKPSDLAVQALHEFPQASCFYDAMDDFPVFHHGLARAVNERMANAIVARSVACSTSSSFLAAKLRPANAHVHVIANGVAASRLPPFDEQATRSRNFGYVGTLGPWFDWRWIAELATAWPDRNVEIHGPVYRAPDIALPDNVQMHAALPHAQALAKMATFAAGLIPFQRSELTDSVDPVKFYEYRALGLAVISTPFGEMRGRPGDERVLLTDAPGQERDRIEALLAARDTAESVTAFRRANDWGLRFEPLAALLVSP